MLVSAKDMLEKAREGKCAVGQLSINNPGWTKSVLLTAGELKSPVILGVSEGTGKYMTGFETVAAMVWAVMEELNITVPVALHLGHDIYDGYYKYIKAGFSSIMFGGSHYPIEENIEGTKELVKVAHAMGLFLKAEAGSIGDEEDDVVGLDECADPRECKAIAGLGIDFLAADIGNIHGKYPENWSDLRLDVLEQVKAVVGDMPLVFHGGTDIPRDMVKKAISLDVTKVSVDTECQLSFVAATRGYVKAGKDLEDRGSDSRKLLASGAGTTRAAVEEKTELSDFVGKA